MRSRFESAGYEGVRSADLADVLQLTVELCSRAGFEIPWISYLAVVESHAVDIHSIKSAPQNSRVETAYIALPECEGQRVATEMATQLLATAKAQPDVLRVTAQTLTERNGSHRILEKAGFRPTGSAEHPEDGIVLEMRL